MCSSVTMHWSNLWITDTLIAFNTSSSFAASVVSSFRIIWNPCPNFDLSNKAVYFIFLYFYIDGQEESSSCPKMKQIINIKGNYKQVFGWKFTQEFIKTIQSIFEFREEYRKLKNWIRIQSPVSGGPHAHYVL